MSAKEEKPTLAGVQNKQRKRNIVIPLDPGSFADAIVQLVTDVSEGVSVEADLEAACKAIDNADLEFSRYGDTLFEVLCVGGRLGSGSVTEEAGRKVLSTNVLATQGSQEEILPFVRLFQNLTRRRPFLIRALENTLIKLVMSIEFFDETGRRKISTLLAVVLGQKVGVLPENIFQALLNDRLVAKGTVLDVLTHTFQDFLVKESLEDLVAILTKAKVAHRLLDFFPPQKRSAQGFTEHFTAAGLAGLADWNVKREVDSKLNELQEALSSMLNSEPPTPAAEVLAMMKKRKSEDNLPDAEVLRVAWTALLKAINMTGKNVQQISQAIVRQIKTYHKVLSTFASNSKAELMLINTIQVQCYEDNRLLKLFSDIVKVLYSCEIVGEDTIQTWYKKGSHTKGRNVFLKDIEPFMKWLEEAEEDEEEDEPAAAAAPTATA